MGALRPRFRLPFLPRRVLAALIGVTLLASGCASGEDKPTQIVASSARVPFHLSTCNRVRRIPKDKLVVFESRQAALDANHTACPLCNP